MQTALFGQPSPMIILSYPCYQYTNCRPHQFPFSHHLACTWCSISNKIKEKASWKKSRWWIKFWQLTILFFYKKRCILFVVKTGTAKYILSSRYILYDFKNIIHEIISLSWEQQQIFMHSLAYKRTRKHKINEAGKTKNTIEFAIKRTWINENYKTKKWWETKVPIT